MAAISLALSALPWPASFPLAALALGRGLQLARREWRKPACQLEFPLEGGSPVIHGGGRSEVLSQAQLSLRGLLATLAWRDERGRAYALHWSADTLPRPARRRLRLRFTPADARA